jgi:hypothetical protein
MPRNLAIWQGGAKPLTAYHPADAVEALFASFLFLH